jgi:hypothetical protein
MPLSNDPRLRERQLRNLWPRTAVTREEVQRVLDDLRWLGNARRSRGNGGSNQLLVRSFLQDRIRLGGDNASAAQAILRALPELEGETDYGELLDPYANARDLMSD